MLWRNKIEKRGGGARPWGITILSRKVKKDVTKKTTLTVTGGRRSDQLWESSTPGNRVQSLRRHVWP